MNPLAALHAYVAAHAGPPPAPGPWRAPVSPAETARQAREAEVAAEMAALRKALIDELERFFPEGLVDG